MPLGSNLLDILTSRMSHVVFAVHEMALKKVFLLVFRSACK
jgi:hypothetical protein